MDGILVSRAGMKGRDDRTQFIGELGSLIGQEWIDERRAKGL